MIDRRAVLIGLAAFATLPDGLKAALPIPASKRLEFDILRKGSKLGRHVLTFEPEGDALTVRVAMDLVFKIAGITLYRYSHQVVERWQGQQVMALDAQRPRLVLVVVPRHDGRARGTVHALGFAAVTRHRRLQPRRGRRGRGRRGS